MDSIKQELERLYQLVTSEAEVQAKAKLRQQQLDLEQREQAIAAAMELTAVDPRVQAAFHDGIAEERGRVLALIQQQQDMLARSGHSFAILSALRRSVEGLP